MPAILAILAVSSSSAAELVAIVGALLGVGVVIALLRSSRAERPSPRLEEPPAPPTKSRHPTGPGSERADERVTKAGTSGLEQLDPGVLAGDPEADTVQVSVFAPAVAEPGSTIFVQAFAHLVARAAEALARAREADPDASPRGRRTLHVPIARGARLTFELRLGTFAVVEPAALVVWRGETEGVGFGVDVPAGVAEGTTFIGRLAVRCDGVPAGDVAFKVQIASPAVAAAGRSLYSAAEAHRYEHVFLSYAREDHARVLEAVQVVRALGMSFFQDVLSIDPGERWERRLYEELDTCDALLLFWSVAAKRSEWVRKEVGYALARNGGEDGVAPAIRPVFIEGPPVEAPWDELSKLQWDDPLLHFRV